TDFLRKVVGDIVLHIGLMRAGEHPAVQIHIVLLFCRIPLNGKNKLLAGREVRRPPLLLEQRRERGVVDMTAVAQGVRRIRPRQDTVGFPAGPSVLGTPRRRCACPACLPCHYALLSHGALACAACALMYCSVPAYPWRWRRSTAAWSPAGLGVVSPRPCTIRFDMVNTAVTKTRKYKARSSCPAANKASTSTGPSCVGQSVSFRA